MGETKIVIGPEAGGAVLDFIRRARRRVLIVSPWLSPACADLAVRKQREGVPTVVVTTDDAENMSHQLALSKLVERRKRTVRPPRWSLLVPGLSVMFSGLLRLYLKISEGASAPGLLLPALLLGIGAVLCLLGRGKSERYTASLVERLVVLPKGPLHAKVYVVDDDAAVGSVNFTVAGLKHNIECVAFASGSADEAVRQVDRLLSGGAAAVFEKEGGQKTDGRW